MRDNPVDYALYYRHPNKVGLSIIMLSVYFLLKWTFRKKGVEKAKNASSSSNSRWISCILKFWKDRLQGHVLGRWLILLCRIIIFRWLIIFCWISSTLCDDWRHFPTWLFCTDMYIFLFSITHTGGFPFQHSRVWLDSQWLYFWRFEISATAPGTLQVSFRGVQWAITSLHCYMCVRACVRACVRVSVCVCVCVFVFLCAFMGVTIRACLHVCAGVSVLCWDDCRESQVVCSVTYFQLPTFTRRAT